MKRAFEQEMADEITVQAQIDSLPLLVQFISDQVKQFGFSESRISDITGAIEEAVLNIITFAAGQSEDEISIKCGTHGNDAFLIDIVDSCRPFNMLAATSFPETGDFVRQAGERELSTTKMKRAIRNIEYRRDPKNGRNILCCIVAK